MIKVCHVSTVHEAFDGRIFHKECVSLSKAGYDVSLVVTHEKEETVDGVRIIPLKPARSRIHRFVVKSHQAFWKALLTKAKIIHFHDPELMFMGVLLRCFGRKVIFDSHENIANQIEGKSWLGPVFIRKIVKECYRLTEKICILFFSNVVSVTPEIVAHLSNKKGVLLRNYPIIELIESNFTEREQRTAFQFVYAGDLTKIRGIKEVCDAIAQLNAEAKLVLMGSWENEAYEKACMEGNPRVIYLGVKPIQEVYPIMQHSDVGIATLYPQKNYLNSLPIKAFEYMTCGLPIIMSNFPYWQEAFADCALFVDPNSTHEIREKMQWLIDNRAEAKAIGAIGRKEVQEKYSWEAESQKLIEIYQKLV